MDKKVVVRKKRQARIRKKISGTDKVPRLSVFRSLNHIYGQLIDDVNGKVIVSASSAKAEGDKKKQKKMEKSVAVGKLLAVKAKEKGIARVVFDRRGYKFHGRVKALADSAKKEGLKI